MYRNLSTAALGISGRQSEIIELSLSYGFKGIDVDLVDFQQTAKTHGLPHARRLLDSARLKLSAFRLPLVWDESDEVYKSGLPAVQELAKLAAEIGVGAAITRIAPANDLRPYHENFEFHRRRLAELAELLGQHRLKLGLDFTASADLRKDRAFQFIHSFDALATLVGMIRMPNVGAVVDLFALHASGGTLDEVRKLGAGKIVSVLASDAPADKSPTELLDADRLLPGENGTIDLMATLTALAELGYDGPITPAVSPQSTKGQKRDQIVKTAGERLTAAWNAAGISPSGKLAPAKK
jgi:sugar phosphate isomerase/epimerase